MGAGISDAWPEVSFRNIRLPGGLTVGAARKADGTVTATVASVPGGRLRIQYGDDIRDLDLAPNAGAVDVVFTVRET